MISSSGDGTVTTIMVSSSACFYLTHAEMGRLSRVSSAEANPVGVLPKRGLSPVMCRPHMFGNREECRWTIQRSGIPLTFHFEVKTENGFRTARLLCLLPNSNIKGKIVLIQLQKTLKSY